MRKLAVVIFMLISALETFAQVPFAQKENKDRIDTLQYLGNRLDLDGDEDSAIDYYLEAIQLLIKKKEFYSIRFWKVSLSLSLDMQSMYGDSASLDLEERLLSYIDYPIPIKDNEWFLHNLSNAQTCAFFIGDYEKAIFYGHWYLNQMEMTAPFDKDKYKDYCLTLSDYYRLAKRPSTQCYNFLLDCCKRYLDLTGEYPIEFEDKFLEMDVESLDYIQASQRIKDLYEFYKNNLDLDSTYCLRFINVLLKAGNIYSYFNQNLQAYVCLSELSGFLVSRNIKDAKIFYEMYCQMGSVYLQCDLFDDAIECYNKAFGYKNEVPDFYDVDVHCNINLALCYESKGDFPKALECSEKAYRSSLLRKSTDPESVLLQAKIMYYQYKACCGNIDDYADLVGLADKVDNQPNPKLFELFVLSLAKVSPKYNLDNINDDLVNLLYRIQFDKVRFNLFLMPEDEKFQSLINHISLNDLLFTLHQTGVDKNNDLLTNLCLTLKGGALNSIRQLGKFVKNSNDTALIKQYQRVKSLKSLYSQYIMTSKALADSVHYLMYQSEFELMAKMCKVDSVYIKNYKWDEVTKCLKSNEIVVEFFDYVKVKTDLMNDDGRTYVAFVFKKGWKQPQFFELFNDTIFRKEFNGKIVSMHSELSSSILREKVLDPILTLAKKGDRIFYSPSGVIHNISLENLLDKNGRPMYLNYDFRRISSSSEIIDYYDKSNPKSILLFGDISYDLSDDQMIEQSLLYANYSDNVSRAVFEDDSTRAEFRPIPGTKTEVDNIERVLVDKHFDVKKQSGALASEEAFKALGSKGYDIVHLATHGFFLKDSTSIKKNLLVGKLDGVTVNLNPLLRSGLALAGANRVWKGERIPNGVDDGILTAQEIKDLDLSRTQMVVLSACETGLGDISTDGVFGLQRAFKSAGVQTIVMSLWKVSDNATSLLMTEFYKGIVAYGDRHKAFQQAKEAVRARFPEAYYWAGWVMLD